MSAASYATLYPTLDPVTHDASRPVDYPPHNVVDTFGTVWTSKVHGHALTALEIGSSGKVAFTPNDLHSLDLMLDQPASNVVLRARNSNSLVIGNEAMTADIKVAQSGDIVFKSPSNLFSFQPSGITLAASTGSNILEAPSHLFTVGGSEIAKIAAAGASVSNLVVNGTDFRVPVGAQTVRPAGTEGMVFYNQSTTRFEGFVAGNWSGLGGVVDVDQNTYITAEDVPGSDNNELKFFTAGDERMRIDSAGKLGFGTSNPQYDFDVRGDARALTDSGNSLLLSGAGFDVLAVTGSNTLRVHQTGTHAFLVGGSEIAKIAAVGASVSNLVVNGTDFRVPVGAQTVRPAGTEGMVFYNQSTTRFEGFVAGNWSGLGGVVDVDQNTYITAEDAPGSDNNELKFVTAGDERMRIDSTGKLGYGTSNPEFTFDIVGDLRVSGNIIASSTTLGDGGKKMRLAVQDTGSSNIIDGKTTNDGSGVVVEGVPTTGILASATRNRFEKSILWHVGAQGMPDLGKKDAWDSESYWKMRGGAFHLSHTNASSGAEIEYIMRVNENDELQLVRHIVPTDGSPESFNVVAKFGNSATKYAVETGYADIDYDQTVLDVTTGTADVYIKSFMAYDNYVVYGALFPVSVTPTTADVVAAAAANGLVTGSLLAATDNVSFIRLSKIHNGSALGAATMLKFCTVVRNASDNSLSVTPRTGFVLNDYSVAINKAVDAALLSSTSYTIRITGVTWSSLSARDMNLFQTLMQQAIVRAAKKRNIKINSLTLSFADGSILCTVVCVFDSADTTVVLNTFGDSLAVLDGPKQIPFQDVAPLVIDQTNATSTVVSVERVESVPEIVSVFESGSTATSVALSWQVFDAKRTVSRLHILTSLAPLAEPLISSTVVAGATAYPITQATGTTSVQVDTGVRTYVYVVAENSDGIYSFPERVISEPFTVIMPSSVSVAVSGAYEIASQCNLGVATKAGMSVVSTASSGTAHLIVYEAGAAEIPPTASDAMLSLGSVVRTSTGFP